MTRPAFGIDRGDGRQPRGRRCARRPSLATPFGTLLHFAKDIDDAAAARAASSRRCPGHFATLLRGTVETLLPDHDVYITDWHNARDVGLAHGRFGFDDYVEHLIRFLEAIGPGAHVLAVCQPCVQALAAAAVMAEDEQPGAAAQHDADGRPDRHARSTRPRSTSSRPRKPIDWFERT